MSKTVLRAIESDVPSGNERTLERLHASGAIEGGKRNDGSYHIRVITEGKGSSGFYPAETLRNYADAFDGVKSFFDHPDYAWAPEERSVLKVAGRLVPGTVKVGETEEGLTAVYSDFKPREEYRQFFDDFGDTLGFSIYVGATFSEAADGTKVVESFDRHDPYASVDVVVAAGRGGRFEQARESLKTIESSLGITEGSKPSVEASAQEEEGNMTKEEMQAILAEALAPVLADVAALKTAATEKATAEADAEAISTAVAEALTSYDEKVAAIAAEADLIESQRAVLTESARKGEDITEALEGAKAIAAEAKAQFAATENEGHGEDGFVFESATSNKADEDILNAAIEGVR